MNRSWHSTHSNHFWQQGALTETAAFRTWMHMRRGEGVKVERSWFCLRTFGQGERGGGREGRRGRREEGGGGQWVGAGRGCEGWSLFLIVVGTFGS